VEHRDGGNAHHGALKAGAGSITDEPLDAFAQWIDSLHASPAGGFAYRSPF